MKKILLSTLLMLSLSAFSFGQNLNLSQIVSLFKKENIAKAEEFLTSKGWELHSVEDETVFSSGSLVFSYNRSDYKDRAESFVGIFYKSDYYIIEGKGMEKTNTVVSSIGIQIHKESKYNEYLNQIKAWGGKLIDSYVKDESFYKVYQGTTLTYVIETFIQDDGFQGSKTLYSIKITHNDDY